jgi:hypothetical protein
LANRSVANSLCEHWSEACRPDIREQRWERSSGSRPDSGRGGFKCLRRWPRKSKRADAFRCCCRPHRPALKWRTSSFSEGASYLITSHGSGNCLARAELFGSPGPKKSSKVETDLTEDVVRNEALPLGLVDIKVCSVDAIWSGLKLVIRKSER